MDGGERSVFVERFVFEPDKEYPDGASVEFWHNGVGKLHAYNKDIVLAAKPSREPVCFRERGAQSVRAARAGRELHLAYEWFAANVGGDFSVVGCNDAGVIAEPLRAARLGDGWRLTGRFGVFANSTPHVEWRDSHRHALGTSSLRCNATPLLPLVLDGTFIRARRCERRRARCRWRTGRR